MTFPVSDHCDGRRFRNPHAPAGKSLGDVLRWILFEPSEPWPAVVPLPDTEPPPPLVAPGDCAITFVNHCTFLLQWQGLRVLTDPIFSERASPLSWTGPRRVMPPGIRPEALPRVDVVLVSHNHYDHLDAPSLRWLFARDRPRVLTPLGNARILRRLGDVRITELDWWDAIDDCDLRVQLTPAQHWSSRARVPRNAALWGGFWLETHGTRVYFAADTGYGPHFADIARRCGTADVSLLPIGAYEPRWFMRELHMNPDDAVRAHTDLGSALSIATHFGTFRLTNEGHDAPVRALAEARALRGVSPERFRVLRQGETFTVRR